MLIKFKMDGLGNLHMCGSRNLFSGGGGGIFAIILQFKFNFFFSERVGLVETPQTSFPLDPRSRCYIWKILSKVSRVYEKFCPYILALNSFFKTRLVIENWNNMSRRQEIKFAQPGVLKDQRYQSIRIKKCSCRYRELVGGGGWKNNLHRCLSVCLSVQTQFSRFISPWLTKFNWC